MFMNFYALILGFLTHVGAALGRPKKQAPPLSSAP